MFAHGRPYGVLLGVVLAFVSTSAFAAGFDGYFTARAGDLDGDGDTDVYMKWTPRVVMIDLDDLTVPIPVTRRQVPDFVLEQTSSGGFTIQAALSAAQVAVLNTWPVVSDVVKLVPGGPRRCASFDSHPCDRPCARDRKSTRLNSSH